jgi:hypothetical protein
MSPVPRFRRAETITRDKVIGTDRSLAGADWYRVKAAQCDQKAKKVVDQGVKAYFTEMVRDWTCLAELAERQGWWWLAQLNFSALPDEEIQIVPHRLSRPARAGVVHSQFE